MVDENMFVENKMSGRMGIGVLLRIIQIGLIFGALIFFAGVVVIVIGMFFGDFSMEAFYYLFGSILVFFLVAFTLYLFIKRKKNVVYFAISLFWVYAFVNLFLQVDEERALWVPFIWAVIWTFYWLKSKRVKEVFVN